MSFPKFGAAICLILGAVATVPIATAQTVPETAPKGEEHSYEITNFRTESGTVLPVAKIVYGTYGTLMWLATMSFWSRRTIWLTGMAMTG